MILKIFKILFIFLLIAPITACSFGDEDSDLPNAGSLPADSGMSDNQRIVVSLPWWQFDVDRFSFDEAIVSQDMSDTLWTFPNQEMFSKKTLSYAFGFQSLVDDVFTSLMDIAEKSEYSQWMSFSVSYYAAFLSPLDSRTKQWQLDENVLFEDEEWPFHLLIFDLPDGSVDGKLNKAVELFYTPGLESGVMLFSPTYFNMVKYPEKLMGHDMMCKFSFSRSKGVVSNRLYVSNFDGGASVTSMSNLFLEIRQSSGALSFSGIVDMPHLWFDRKDNNGYSVLLMGGVDCNTDNVALFSALADNTNSELFSPCLMDSKSVDAVMPRYNRLWNQLMKSALPEGEAADTVYEYKSPAFLNKYEYEGAGREVADRLQFNKALSRAEDALQQSYNVSPFSVSIFQIE